MINNQLFDLAPKLEVSAWLNTPMPLELEQLRGKVVVLHAFQMLCPSCVSHGIPQATAIERNFAHDEVQVIGIHTVFEHHDVMTLNALKAFVSEYRISFPIAVDRPSENDVLPLTMKKYNMKGTPTLILIDKKGQIRLNHFGNINDMQVARIIGQLLAESNTVDLGPEIRGEEGSLSNQCDDNGCSI